MSKLLKLLKKNLDLSLTIACGLFMVLGLVLDNLDEPGLLLFSRLAFSLAILLGGWMSAKEGVSSFHQKRKLDANILMIVAAVGACLIGHFSEGAILIFIFSLSHSMEAYTQGKSRNAIAELLKLVPETARCYKADGSIVLVNSQDLAVGDLVQVAKGEMVPIDGRVNSAEAYLNEASITGESMPVYKKEGDLVMAGTLNQGEAFDLVVSAVKQDTMMAKIIALVDQAQNNLTERETGIAKIEGVFVKTVLCLVPLFILTSHFIFLWNWSTAFYRGMVLLTVASPCALVASASPAKLAAISRAAKQGMILRGGHVFDLANSIDTVVFDKTGTLTMALPSLTRAYYRSREEEILINRVVKSVEQTSNHPIAEAFLREFEKVDLLELDKIEDITGKGFVAHYQGEVWRIGNRKLLAEDPQNGQVTDFEKAHIEACEKEGATVVFVSRDHELLAFFAITDPIKSESRETIDRLHEAQLEAMMLTGDAVRNSQYVGRSLGLNKVYANLMPGGKSVIIENLQAEGRSVLMVGDGINDAPALAVADLAIAMGNGTDVAIEAADVVLVKNNLDRLPYLLAMSRQVNRIVKQNLVISLSVIVALVLVNVLQIINLPLAVVAHEGSTILVILNGLRMLTFGKKFKSDNKSEKEVVDDQLLSVEYAPIME